MFTGLAKATEASQQTHRHITSHCLLERSIKSPPTAEDEAERFLIEWHRARPGTTPQLAYGRVASRLHQPTSSYDLVVEGVPGDAIVVLDVGCGDGFLLERLRAPGRSLIGVDMSDAELRGCKERFGGAEQNVSLHLARIQAIGVGGCLRVSPCAHAYPGCGRRIQRDRACLETRWLCVLPGERRPHRC